MDLVSVIMSVYNGEKYLKESIESVLSQTYIYFEFIIINDGSTDNTLNIIEEYSGKDNRIRIINKNNTGLTRSLNLGLNMAKGMYMAKIDSDDKWLPHKLEYQINYFNCNKNLFLIGSTALFLIEPDIQISLKRKERAYSCNEIRDCIIRTNPFLSSSVTFKMEALKTVGTFNPFYKNSMDYDMWIRIISKYDTAITNDSLIYYRFHENMMSRRKKWQQVRETFIIKLSGMFKLGFRFKYLKDFIMWTMILIKSETYSKFTSQMK